MLKKITVLLMLILMVSTSKASGPGGWYAGQRPVPTGPACVEVPDGKTTGVGNSDSTQFCIRPLPRGLRRNGDFLCDLFLGLQLHMGGWQQALDNCINLHGVKCQNAGCAKTCQNTVSRYRSQPVFYVPNSASCKDDPVAVAAGRTAACRLGNQSYACDCHCLQQQPQNVRP